MLKIIRLESQIILRYLGAIKPKGIHKIAKKFLDNYLMICRIVPKNIYSFGIKLFYLILEVTAMGIKTISVSR
jgi:hypothetical protein